LRWSPRRGKVPILDDETVSTPHDFLLDLLTQFENHCFTQLHRHEQTVDEWRREQREVRSTLVDPDSDLNDDLTF
jgi:hypothetical protein